MTGASWRNDTQWNHPNLGRISETTCPEHDHELVGALRALGIGCLSVRVGPDRLCDRCQREGMPVREWLSEVTT